MSSPQVRCFWAVRPTEPSLEQVAELVRQLKRPLSSLGLQVTWTAPESYHLTLKFLGNVDEDTLGAMVTQVQTQLRSSQVAPLQLELAGLGAFPDPLRPQVLFVEAHGNPGHGASAELQALHELLDGGLAPLGFAREERPFIPHLTIGRVRHSARPDAVRDALPELLSRYTGQPHGPAFPVDTLILYEVQPAPAGPKYLPIARLPLARL